VHFSSRKNPKTNSPPTIPVDVLFRDPCEVGRRITAQGSLSSGNFVPSEA